MKRILAVDLGISSFGYAILEESGANHYRCIDNSVVMRDTPYDNDGNSKQSLRRSHSSMRSLNEKRKRRVRELARIFDSYGLLSYEECRRVRRENKIIDKWKLRAEDALSRPLSMEELYAILVHMAKHRGYKSIATDDLLYELELELGLTQEEPETLKDDEKRKVYTALKRLERLKERYEGETIAQIIHKAVLEGELRSYRNHDDYEKMIRREDIKEEIETIVKKQCEFGALPLDSGRCMEFIEALHATITSQTMPENDPELIGKCSYYPQEKAAPRYSYLYDIYRLYKTLADLNISNYEITAQDREKIIEFVTQKASKGKNIGQLLYKDIRKLLGLGDGQKIYGKDDRLKIGGKSVERTLVKFFFLKNISKFPSLMRKIISHTESLDIFGEIAETIRAHKTPRPAMDALKDILKRYEIEYDDMELIELIKGKSAGTLHISHRFIKDALPHFAEGKNEKEIKEILGVHICENYGDFPKSLKYLHLGKDNKFESENSQIPINNHAVKSLASWSLRLIADLSWRYGVFDEIIIESARDVLPKSIQDAIDKSMKKREKELDAIIGKYKNEFQSIDRKMARKIKLLESQNFMDLYSGGTIAISDLLEGRADIEHIVPRSLGGLSADYNLVIAHKDSNMQKSNRLPMDWLGGDKQYLNRVEMLFAEHKIDWKKRKNLLATSLDEIYSEVAHSKTLRATSYLESLVSEIIKMYYPFADEKSRIDGKAVRNVPGKTTSKTRSWLGIKSKSRKSNFHHAEDAMILATISRGWQQRLHTMLKENYGKSEDELKDIWKKFTPHIEGISLAEYIDEAYERFMSKGLESIWYRDMFGGIRSVSFRIDKKPLSGASHKETIYSSRHRDPENPDKILPTVRKSILDAFGALNILNNRHKWDREKFIKKYDKEIRQKLWLYRMGNLNDPVFRAIEKRAGEIGDLMESYIYKEPSHDKEIDERYQEELRELLQKPIVASGKAVYKVPFVDDSFSHIEINRGRGNRVIVRTDKNFLAVMFERGKKDRLEISKIDLNSMHRLRHSDAMIVYLNEIIYLFNKKKIMHYGALRSFSIDKQGGKYIKLFNPRFPGSPKSQPGFFSTGSSIKAVSIGSATGVIKVHLDLDGRVKGYEKYGSIPKELERDFLEESGYGVMEDNTHH